MGTLPSYPVRNACKPWAFFFGPLRSAITITTTLLVLESLSTAAQVLICLFPVPLLSTLSRLFNSSAVFEKPFFHFQEAYPIVSRHSWVIGLSVSLFVASRPPPLSSLHNFFRPWTAIDKHRFPDTLSPPPGAKAHLPSFFHTPLHPSDGALYS